MHYIGTVLTHTIPLYIRIGKYTYYNNILWLRKYENKTIT